MLGSSQVSAWTPERGRERYAYTAGAPNSCVVGADDVVYVCQNGGAAGAWRAEEMSVPSIQRIEGRGGRPEILVTEIDGVPFRGPNSAIGARIVAPSSSPRRVANSASRNDSPKMIGKLPSTTVAKSAHNCN